MRTNTLCPLADAAPDFVGGDSLPDPLRYYFPLPFARVFYPMGYPVEVATNAPEILRVAEDIWGAFPPLQETPAILVRLAVEGSVAAMRSAAPVFRGQGHLISATLGPDNSAVADLSRGFIHGWFTDDVVSDHGWFRYHFLEPLVYLSLGSLYYTPVHAACVSMNDRALVLCGESGAGKTCLAYACAKRGWTYVADDASHLVRDRDDFVIGRPHHIRFRDSAAALFPELRAFPTVIRPNGKSDIEVNTRDLGLTIACTGVVKGIVFPKRSQCGPPGVVPYPELDALRRLQQVVCFGDETVRIEQLEHLRRFVQLPTLRLDYSDFEGAVECLGSLI